MTHWKEIIRNADALISENKIAEAVVLMESALFENPDVALLHNNIGWAYLHHLEDPERAFVHLEYAAKIDPRLVSVRIHIATYWNHKGLYRLAETELRAALEGENPDRPYLLYLIARNYELMTEWNLATRTYKEALMETTVEWQFGEITNGLRRVRKKRLNALLPF
ncbi:MAG: tetratricopeptide repeat protein [Flavobacteriales bacterium]|jgi:tetratricopeptide (TPR) repeat protein